MSESKSPKEIVDKMYNNDPFSQWMGIERVEDGAGTSVLKMTVRKEMLNGFKIAHGGITYSLADSALAFASNAHGQQAVSIQTSVHHVSPVFEGDILTTDVKEEFCNHRIGVYSISIVNQNREVVALFKGTVYRKQKNW
jgi:acyl-CoA thioesterase